MRVGPSGAAAPVVPCAPAVSMARAASDARAVTGSALVAVPDDCCELQAPARAPTRARIASRRVLTGRAFLNGFGLMTLLLGALLGALLGTRLRGSDPSPEQSACHERRRRSFHFTGDL